MSRAERLNQSAFSEWINGSSGRASRVVVGTAFLSVGIIYRDNWWGIAALVWSVSPLTAGSGDVCYISGALGGPLKGCDIRDRQATTL